MGALNALLAEHWSPGRLSSCLSLLEALDDSLSPLDFAPHAPALLALVLKTVRGDRSRERAATNAALAALHRILLRTPSGGPVAQSVQVLLPELTRVAELR